MKLNDYNVRAINDVYKNAHIALQSISNPLPTVKDGALSSELREEYEGYERIIGNVSSFMKENKITPKDISVMQKAMMWTSIKMKTMVDDSKNKASEMMLKGTEMGINELTAMKNEKVNLTPEVFEHVNQLLNLEESYRKRLMKFL